MIGFIGTLFTIFLLIKINTALSLITQFTFTIVGALGFSIFTSYFMAIYLNIETSTSNYYEVFLPFLVQSPWDLRTQLKTLLYCSSLRLLTPPAYNCPQTTFVVPYNPWRGPADNTSHGRYPL
jgi:hypothetical protein